MDWFVRWQKDIETLESGDAVQAIKKISDPPQLSDFNELTFPEEDLKAIPKCKVGDCEVKVDEPALERVQKEVNWSAPDAHEQASRLIRQMTLEAAQEYHKNGDASLGAYRDKKRPTFLDKEFDGLLEELPLSRRVHSRVPPLLGRVPECRASRVLIAICIGHACSSAFARRCG